MQAALCLQLSSKATSLADMHMHMHMYMQAMLLLVGKNGYKSKLSAVFEAMARDESWRVRKTIACGFHEVCTCTCMSHACHMYVTCYCPGREYFRREGVISDTYLPKFTQRLVSGGKITNIV